MKPVYGLAFLAFLSVFFNHSDWVFCNFSIAAQNTKNSTVASLSDIFRTVFYRVVTLGLKLKRIESFSIAWKSTSAQAESPK
ncbi:hypothetical protein J2W30_004310 [Variovorax boronicumulans]|uniref:hypothetical protein n=1 Tax=Variovorax boronicumulans TaxID=436515 RepID=UPI002786C3C3|nr:hypothetical protein [Variovorax boronicumulans]MDQ0036535.1 hypothetical protein [Variovorax boronicumulans]